MGTFLLGVHFRARALFLLLKWISGICTYRPAALSSNRPPLRHLGVCSHLPHSSVLAIHTWPVKSHSLHRGPSTRHALSLPRSVSSNSNWLSDESIIIPLGCSQQMGRCHSLSIFIVPIRLTLSQPLIINLSTCEARPVALSPVPTTRRSRWFYWVSAILHVHDTSFLSHARWLALPPER